MDFQKAETVLDLDNIRAALVRMEDTILFALIERSQFFESPSVYEIDKYKIEGFSGSFMEWLLLQTEKTHSQVRRYQAPDEMPFFPDELITPILPPIKYPRILAYYGDEINVNKEILQFYVNEIVPGVSCNKGDQSENSGSVAVCDVECLQAISRRIHFGKFVAESKFRENRELYTKLIEARDVKGIEDSITNSAVEQKILDRLREKCQAYGTDPGLRWLKVVQLKVKPEVIIDLYQRYVIPLTKKVEVDYLLRRLEDPL
ncbi:hypothetical protein FT663_01145 [Candidozyma haemuli var. vulneris]|uniref:Chorismate mutase n=1 Tax=Candidozyma haemuli TaxID=45357 RepID=A0A2V1AWC5_9ASCO|nr:chorismate mutase [[Candida] haemuloni]KAF3993732.1 hypothetical protein FT662_00445 [[Candida] haemuloni var. vulneris]KAF3994789.1 hypothetical protein FT663_01145 [[Candida] haemuloni var. vulneris]PVH22145.1 chorismate mutase [[Candida] haemuloni]